MHRIGLGQLVIENPPQLGFELFALQVGDIALQIALEQVAQAAIERFGMSHQRLHPLEQPLDRFVPLDLEARPRGSGVAR